MIIMIMYEQKQQSLLEFSQFYPDVFDGTTAIFFKGYDVFWKVTLLRYMNFHKRHMHHKGAWRYAPISATGPTPPLPPRRT